MISNMLWALLLITAASLSLAGDDSCMSAATSSGDDDDKSSMMQTHANVAPQKKTNTQGSKPKVTSAPCGFESSASPYCGTWSNAKGDQFDWTRKSGSTPTSRTGPSRAHSGNHYMYIEASWRRGRDTAILESVATTFRAGARLSFQYHMFGPRIGTLKVVFKEASSGPVIVWQRNGDRGNKWALADIDLSPYAGKTGVIQLHGIITHRCASFLGDIAIDELSLTPGSAAPLSAPAPAPLAPGAATKVFDRIDSDNSGMIKRAELNKAVADGTLTVGSSPSVGATPVAPGTTAATSSASALFKRLDTDNSGIIKSDEWDKGFASGIIGLPR